MTRSPRETQTPKGRRLGGVWKRYRAIAAIAVAALFNLTAFAYWRLTHPRTLASARLQDGSVLSLAALTYGTHHVFDPSLLPERIANQVKAPFEVDPVDLRIVEDVPYPCGVAWFRITRASRDGLWDSFEDVVLEDEHGCAFRGDPEVYGGPEDEDVLRVHFPPRLAPDARLFVRRRNFHTNADDFRIELPLPKNGDAAPLPDWRAESLPRTATTSHVKAHFGPFRQRMGDFGRIGFAKISGVDAQHPECRWDLVAVNSEDRFGNRRDLGLKEDLSYGLPVACYCNREPAWKLTGYFEPPPWTEPPDYRWGPTKIPIHRNRGIGPEDGRIGGATGLFDESAPIDPQFDVVRVSGKVKLAIERELWLEDLPPGSPDEPSVSLRVRFEGLQGPLRLAAVNVNGETVPALCKRLGVPLRGEPDTREIVETTGVTDLVSGEWSYVSIPVARNAKTLSISFVGYRPETVTCLVAPAKPPGVGG
jgi:hypothetical protein